MARPPLERPPASLAAAALALVALACAACAGGADAAGGSDRHDTTGGPGAAAVGVAGATPTADSPDGPAVPTAELPAALTEQRLDWSSCGALDPRQGDDETSPSPPPGGDTGWQCATLTAPVDYATPDGSTIELALIRTPARAGDAERIGSLLFNFGGPGGSGVATLPAFASDYAALHERYDLVSLDPRGVGRSGGVRCLGDRELDAFFAADPAPRTDEGRQRLTERLREFASGCQRRAGDLLPHLTTANTARDLDLLRAVLGDEKLNYFGISYGTQLGAVYAHLFPRRVGRVVFDAVVDPTVTPKQSALSQAKGFERAFGNYVAGCAESVGGDGTGDPDNTAEACPLGEDPKEATERLADLLDQLREEPMPTRDAGGRRLTRSLALSGIAQALYSQDFWAYLSQGLADALDEERPDGTVLLALGDAINGRNPDGTYTTLQSSLTAISCADARQRYEEADVTEALDAFRAASQIFGPPLAWSLLSCTHWPVAGAARQQPVDAGAADEILLIGTTGDPATPYEGTQRMRRALGGGVGVVLTYDGEGHGAYTSGNDCVRAATDAFLLDGKLPEDGTTCV